MPNNDNYRAPFRRPLVPRLIKKWQMCVRNIAAENIRTNLTNV